MELVLLGDIQNGYASNWARIANTAGVAEIQIGDRFREQGFGQGAEELEVAGIDISVVGGASRLFFNRAANATQPEVHRLGAVLLQVGIKAEKDGDVSTTVSVLRTVEEVPSNPADLDITDVLMDNFAIRPFGGDVSETPTANGSAAPDEQVEIPAGIASDADTTEPLVPLKRGRGRPRGAKNKAKEEVAFPPGF